MVLPSGRNPWFRGCFRTVLLSSFPLDPLLRGTTAPTTLGDQLVGVPYRDITGTPPTVATGIHGVQRRVGGADPQPKSNQIKYKGPLRDRRIQF